MPLCDVARWDLRSLLLKLIGPSSAAKDSLCMFNKGNMMIECFKFTMSASPLNRKIMLVAASFGVHKQCDSGADECTQ